MTRVLIVLPTCWHRSTWCSMCKAQPSTVATRWTSSWHLFTAHWTVSTLNHSACCRTIRCVRLKAFVPTQLSTSAISSGSCNIVAGVIPAVHADWDTANYRDVTSHVLLAGPGADIPGAQVRRRTSALHHQDGKLVAESRSNAILTETCNCYTASEENGAGLIWHE